MTISSLLIYCRHPKFLMIVGAVVLTAGLTACTAKELVEKMADPEKLKIARSYHERLVAGEVEVLAAELDPAIRTGKEIEQLNFMRTLIPPGPPRSVEIVGYYMHYTNGQVSYNVTHQYAYEGKWVISNVVWTDKGNATRQILGMNITPLDQSLQEIHAFTFRRAGLAHYLVLIAAMVIPVFVLVTLVVCIRTKLPRRKWLWVLFILVGFGQVSLNWTTGETAVRPLHFQLFGAGVSFGGLYGPWMLMVSVPVGAIAFWFKRRRMLQPPPFEAAQSADPAKP
jgi:hypothetical protein